MIAVVAHDAGGAELISSYVRREGVAALFVLDGPARGIFERKLGAIRIVSLEQAIEQCDSVLCGTGWQSEFEWRAIGAARRAGKPAIAFLDHWGNYQERFIRNGETCFPDEIWVGDNAAHQLARAAFPQLPVKLVANPYFLDLQDELRALGPSRLSSGERGHILYVAEPLREHGRLRFGDERFAGYVEEDALRYFLANVTVLGPAESITIRPHPSESRDKYDWATHEFSLPILRGGARPLLNEIVDSDIVVGCESMALVVGVLAGKRVVSCIPPGGKRSDLPYPEIVGLQTLLSKSGSKHANTTRI